ncbi:histidinol-phosphate phosphatase family domain-containing protein/HAD-superfamily hydrolase, subfamily IIIA [Bacillus sp. 491mf]|uniref:HAD-IIIA family hydrolase n=1 Tax=Bacillus TaxID=1386 RepID=UPI000558A189|nr:MULTISPECIES: HAD-IIIA family hydrolase [unclassified Bacillus (in: firmicutes)]SFC04318.1 histidinol-phosphate phosphatase family domain-containing protein/HAD-superfamily hydrolase, subfamily IIIA [Bacillus sp. 491mf]
MTNKRNIEAIFIDRDGTIGGDTTIHYPGEFQLFPFSEMALNQLKAQNIQLFSFTNQPGIADEKATTEDFIQELEAFGFDDIYLCPHRHSDGCSCRKPETGMLLQAAKNHHLDLTKCVVIGDRWSDIVAGIKVGATTILVQTGAGYDALHTYRHKWSDMNADYIATNLEDAVSWLFSHSI